ncbi:hypothetical protein LV457_19990, partial [Mycobacterium sp. MYCO198283]|nr:hypothetical protein [Mycobacterium sp. MYCO198283]
MTAVQISHFGPIFGEQSGSYAVESTRDPRFPVVERRYGHPSGRSGMRPRQRRPIFVSLSRLLDLPVAATNLPRYVLRVVMSVALVRDVRTSHRQRRRRRSAGSVRLGKHMKAIGRVLVALVAAVAALFVSTGTS